MRVLFLRSTRSDRASSALRLQTQLCKPADDQPKIERRLAVARINPTIRLITGASAAIDGIPPTVAHREFARAALRVNVFAFLVVRRLTGEGVEPTSRDFISPSPSARSRPGADGFRPGGCSGRPALPTCFAAPCQADLRRCCHTYRARHQDRRRRWSPQC